MVVLPKLTASYNELFSHMNDVKAPKSPTVPRPVFASLFLHYMHLTTEGEKKFGHKHTNRRTYIDNLSRNIFVWMYIEEVEVDNPLIGLYASPKWVNREIEQTLKHIFDVFWIFLARSRLYRLFCPSVSMCMYFRNDG